MKTKISKLYDGPAPWTEIPEFKPSPLPEKLVKITGGNRKQNATISKVLNRHPAFRQAVERIFKGRDVGFEEALRKIGSVKPLPK